MAGHIKNHFRKAIYGLVVLLTIVLNSSVASALTAAQQHIFNEGIQYYNAELGSDSLISCSSGSTGGATGSLGKIYFVGDSLSVGMRDSGDLANKVTSAGGQVSKIEATVGDSVSAALPKIQADASAIESSDTVVIELGTNPGSNTSASASSFVPDIKNVINVIKTDSPTAKIFWMNAYADNDKTAYSGVNQAISDQSGTLGYSVIDWHSEAQNNNSKYAPFSGVPGPPLVHPTEHYGDLASFVVSNIGSGGSTSQTGTGTCSCSVTSTDTSSTTGAQSSSSSANQKTAFDYFIAKGLTAAQSAGIVGNFTQESGVNPTDSGGYLAQWGGGRLSALEAYAAQQNKPVTDLGLQLDYVWLELTNGPGAGADESAVLANLKKTTTVDDNNLANNSTVQFMGTVAINAPGVVPPDTDPADLALPKNINGYENPGYPRSDSRITYAQQVLKQYGGDAGSVPIDSCGDSGGGTTTGTGGCVNPFSQIKDLGPERIDMGVDYAAPAGSPILAMCDSKVIGTANGGTGWSSPTDTEACVYLQITDGTYSGKSYYVCEDIAPTVTDGQTVKAGDEIATFLPSSTGIETGWGSGTPYGALAASLNQECTNGDPGCWASAAGVSFNKFLVSTGATSGVFVSGAPPQTMPPGYP